MLLRRIMSTRSMRRRLWRWCHRVLELWTSLHVEFQGCYSTQRQRQLQSYTKDLSIARLMAICLGTPLPSLCLSLLTESVSLPPPEAGISRNWFMFVRSCALIALIGAGELVQIGQGIPKLKLCASQVAFVAITAATFAIACVLLVSSLTIFPLPFGLVLAGPPTVLALALCFIYISRSTLRAEPALWTELKRQLNVFYCEVALTIIYPLYIFGYLSLSGVGQAFFVVLSPAMQIAAKNFVSRNLTDHNEMKLVTIIFFVEIFGVLYTSSVLESTSSWYTIALIMGTDALQFGLALFDTTRLLNEVRVLMKKIPHTHPIAKENFVQIAERLLKIEYGAKPQPRVRARASAIALWQNRLLSWIKAPNAAKAEAPPSRVATLTLKNSGLTGKERGFKYMVSHKARVYPIRPPQRKNRGKRYLQPDIATYSDVKVLDPAAAEETPALGIEAIFSRQERDLFIQKTSQVLFVTEYVVLVEYIEVAMPTILGAALWVFVATCHTSMIANVVHVLALSLGVHQLILYHMPNSAYYPQLAGLSSDQLYLEFCNVMAYAVLELLSLVMATVVLKRTLGFSGLNQLAFVLEKQADIIQMKLLGVFVYVMQVPLKHVGKLALE